MKILRFKQIREKLGLGRTALYHMDRTGELRAVKLTPGTVGWLEEEVDAWLAKKLASRDGGAPPAADSIQA